MFSLIFARTNSWANNGDAGDLRRHRTHYDVIVFFCRLVYSLTINSSGSSKYGVEENIFCNINSWLPWTYDTHTIANCFTGNMLFALDKASSLALQWRHNGPQITRLTIVYSSVYSDADQRKHQSSASLAFVWGIHRWPVNSPHKWPVTLKMFPFDDVIMGLADSKGRESGSILHAHHMWRSRSSAN